MSIDPAAEAWRVVRALREEFLGRLRQPTDDDWQQAIEDGFTRLTTGKTKGAIPAEDTEEYEQGYEDALSDIESAVDRERNSRRRKKLASKLKVA